MSTEQPSNQSVGEEMLYRDPKLFFQIMDSAAEIILSSKQPGVDTILLADFYQILRKHHMIEQG